MPFWLAERQAAATAAAGHRHAHIQRFDPRFWSVNFPRPMMAAVTAIAPDALRVDCLFHRSDDLAGLIWDSADRFDHPLLSYDEDSDYRRTTLAFRWRSSGIMPLDAVNGPTLTIEGKDAAGQTRSWYVRLWNYASGTPQDAEISLPFSALEGGFLLPSEADPLFAGAIDRMFISLVPPGYSASGSPLAAPQDGWVELTDIRCDGARAMLPIGDVVVPPNGLAIATAYDDSFNITPQRVIRNLHGLGYRGAVNHYVGMSHYFALAGQAGALLVDDAVALNQPCIAWHRVFLAEAKLLGLSPILSLSYELFDAHCPDAWKQRDHLGNPAQTGWVPPSALLSPANDDAMGWLQSVGAAFAALMVEAGLPVRFQIGEPWWWITAQGRICLYDDAAKAALGGNPPVIADLRQPLTPAQMALLDSAGALLAASTAALADAVRAVDPASAELLLLIYLPTILDEAMPEAQRANLPAGWAHPAFDVLQIEDYDWVTQGRSASRRKALAAVDDRLGYPLEPQHYMAGFVLNGADADAHWPRIAAALAEAEARGMATRIVWALPQVCRDGFTAFSNPEDEMRAFDDVQFPLALGQQASVSASFSTSVVTTASGHEHRGAGWADARLAFDAGPGVRSEAELGQLISFFRARRGAARGFRFRDPTDHSSNGMTGEPGHGDQLIATGDGAESRFQLVKHYGSDAGDDPQHRLITHPDGASLLVSIDGTPTSAFTLLPGGIIDLDAPLADGAVLRAGFRFDVPVRFAEDRLEVSGASFAAGEIPSVPLVELRGEGL